MRCPSCGTVNPAQARFCLGCGHLLVNGVVCATCHTLLPPQARYCFHCGALVIGSGLACPQCGAAAVPGQALCSACGSALPQPTAPRINGGRGVRWATD